MILVSRAAAQPNLDSIELTFAVSGRFLDNWGAAGLRERALVRGEVHEDRRIVPMTREDRGQTVSMHHGHAVVCEVG